ncbi:MAG: hypothetical protein ACRDTC_21415 [Pseudonocardiaceae bacterium]
MILTCAVFGGLIVFSLDFWRGMLAIALGNMVLMAYVGALSFLAGRTGKNFALTAAETFGRRGWNEALTALAAGVGFVAVTLLGIRSLAVIGMIAAPVYVVLDVVAIGFGGRALPLQRRGRVGPAQRPNDAPAHRHPRRHRGAAGGGQDLVVLRAVAHPARGDRVAEARRPALRRPGPCPIPPSPRSLRTIPAMIMPRIRQVRSSSSLLRWMSQKRSVRTPKNAIRRARSTAGAA